MLWKSPLFQEKMRAEKTASDVCLCWQEEVSFMASIARCMAAGRPGALLASAEPVPEPSENLFQKLMLVRC